MLAYGIEAKSLEAVDADQLKRRRVGERAQKTIYQGPGIKLETSSRQDETTVATVWR